MSRETAVPPGIVPLVQRDGSMHPAWRRFFEAMWARLGGYDGAAVLAGTGVSVSTDDDGVSTVSLANSGVTAGTYASPTSVTVDAKGRVTAISS